MKLNIIPPRLKGFLIDNNTGSRTEITDDITNWNELEVRQEREGFSGVFIVVQQAITVCRNAKQILKNAFRSRLLSMNITFEIMARGLKDFIYNTIHQVRLDVGSYEEHKDYISIEGQALTFDNLVKSVGKTKYDIPVSDLSTMNWRYQHNHVLVNPEYTIGETDQVLFFPRSLIPLGITQVSAQTVSINLDSASMPLGGHPTDFRSEEIGITSVYRDNPDYSLPETLPDGYFYKEMSDAPPFYLSFKFDVTSNSEFGNLELNLMYRTAEGQNMILEQWDINKPSSGNKTVTVEFNQALNLMNGEELKLLIKMGLDQIESTQVPDPAFITISNFDHFYIKYVDKSNLTDNIPIVSPTNLANKLLDNMSNGDAAKKYHISIDTDTDNQWNFNHYLVAAESIRGFDNANFHANFNDFITYMQFLGYEYEADEYLKIIYFRKRSQFFNPQLTAIDLTKEEVSNMIIKANSDYAYSTVRVGYEKPDIEDTNGRYAVCGAFDYSTQYENTGILRDSSLEIICPYKADPIEIETLSWTRGEQTTDQKADNDIFMLAGEGLGNNVIETRQSEYTVLDPDIAQIYIQSYIGWYNVPYIPYFIARRNEGKIGTAIDRLIFAGTNTYRDAILRGIRTDNIYYNIEISNRLFDPITYEFSAGTFKDLPIIGNRSGLVRFNWQGQEYKGYIKGIMKNYSAEQSVIWTLFGKIN